MEIKPIKVTLCFRLPVKTYFGGIATIVKKYMDRTDLFSAEGVELSLFDWHDEKVEAIKNQKLRNLLYWKSFRRAARSYCKQNRPDLFHIHTAREFSFLRDLLVGTSIARDYHVKYAMTIHFGDAKSVFNRIPKILHKHLIRLLNKYCSCIFFLSEEIAKSYVAIGVRSDICSVLYNFHDMPAPSEKKQVSKPLRCLFVGAIERRKGILELIDAIESIKENVNLHLDVCGLANDPSVRHKFEEFCERNKDLVTLHGYVTGNEKALCFGQSDVLVLPSFQEGMPLVVLEALATGCAIISTRVGGTPEILTDKNAVWVNTGDAKSLAYAIEMLANNPEKVRAMQQENLRLSASFSLNTNVKKLCSIYHSIT